MVAMVVVCSAWTAPGEISKGQNMNTKSKQKSLAMLALTAVLGGSENPVALAQAPQAVNPAAYGRAGAGAPPQPGGLPGGAGNGPYQNRAGGFGGAADPFGAPGMPQRAGWRGDSERGAQLDAKLRGIMLDEVAFDGLPLAEVLRFVSDESRKHDPEKKGINFLIKPNVGWPQSPAIDPTSGLPTPAAVSEPIDVGATAIKFNLPLRHISMKDLLDAIVKVADRPIEYALEDYGVVFAIRPEGVGFQPTGMMMPTPQLQPQPQQAAETHLAVSTFRVNTNTFAAGVENVFGIKLGNPGSPGGKDGLRSRQIQAAMKELMAQLGISVEGGKTVFYNELTGVLMVRGTMEDLDVVRAAIETLGEPDKELPGGGVGFAPGTSPGQPNAALTEEQRKFRARYGLEVPGR
jgi:hypothetical protein